MKIAGVILAGGASSRMGMPKHALRVNSMTFLERQMELLQKTGMETVMVSIAKKGQIEGDHFLLLDKYPGIGPLGALATAMEKAFDFRATHLCVLAVDLPELSGELIQKLFSNCTSETGIVPAHSADGSLEPLCAIYPLNAMETVTKHIRQKTYGVRDFAQTLIAKGMLRRYLLTGDEIHQLRNVNSPEDL